MTAPVLDTHAACEQNAELYGAEFCLATRKPGPCKGTHRPGTATPPPKPVKPVKQIAVPNAPTAKTPQQLIAERQAANTYAQAYLHAQALATTAGVSGQRHAGVQTAVADYARALHQHGQAIAADDRARAHAQRAHDSAIVRNKAYAASAAAAHARALAHTRARVAHAKLKKAVHVAKFPLTYPAPAGFAAEDVEEFGTFDPAKHPHGFHGRWASVGDKLKMHGRIQLGRDEHLAHSTKIHDVDGSATAVVAGIHGPGGPKLRLGIVHPEDANRWRGANRGGTVELDAGQAHELRGVLAKALPEAKASVARYREELRAAHAKGLPKSEWPNPEKTLSHGSIEGRWGALSWSLDRVEGVDDLGDLGYPDAEWRLSFDVSPAGSAPSGMDPYAVTTPAQLRQLDKALTLTDAPLTASGSWAQVADLYALPGAQFEELYALTAAAHWMCGVDQFCRNPLHPGPCKGWKHTLHAVAPGAFHAYEKQRVDKLNAYRKARIKALQDAGQPVPKSLLKEITYKIPTAPQAGFTPPTAKEAQAALPATAKEIAAKLAMKHADIAAAKLDAQHEALATTAKALGKYLGPSVKAKLADIATVQKIKGEPLTEHPVLKSSIKHLAELAGNLAGVGDKSKADIHKNIAEHVEGGHSGLPLDVEAAINVGKKHAEEGQKKIEQAAHRSGAQTFLDSYKDVDWSGATPEAKKKAVANLDKIIEQQHATKAQKITAAALANKINNAKMKPEPPKATGPLAHPDMMHAVGTLKGGFTTSEKLHSLSQPGVTKAEFDKLGTGKKAVVDALAEMHDAAPAKVQNIAHKLGIDPLDIKIPGSAAGGPAVQTITPAAPLGPDVAPHVKLAQSVATGATHMTDTKKLDAYAKLTQAEYHALPVPIQDKIHAGLVIAHHKFLSPAKKDAAKKVLDKLGLPKETPQGAGAPHAPGSPLEASQAAHLDAMAQAAAAANGLAHGTSLSTEHKELQAANAKKLLEDHPTDTPEMLATGYASIWMKKHNISEQIGPGLDMAVQTKAAAEFKHMIQTGQKTPPKGGVLEAIDLGLGAQAVADAAGVHTQSPQAGGGAVSPLQHAQAHAAVYELAKGVPMASLDSMKELYALHPAHETADDVTGVYAKKWAEKHLEGLGLTPGQRSEITAKAETEMHSMIMKGELFPPAHGVLEATVAGHSPSELAAALKTAAGLPNAGPPVPVAEPATKLGKGAAIAKIPADVKAGILSAFKAQPSGKYLADPPEDIYQNVLNLAHAYGQPGALLSLAQVLKVIDETQAKKLGVQNASLMEAKIKDWLATPEGAKLAKKIKADTPTIEALKSGKPVPFTPPPGVTINKGAKVQQVGGPGKFDETVPSAKFKIHTVSEARAEQAAHMSKTGKQWTPAQKSALTSYTDSSHDVNTYLRGKSSGSAQVKQKAVDIQSAMVPLTNHHLLMRGTGWDQLPEGFRDSIKVKGLIGKTFQEPAFLSTSVDGGGFAAPLKLEIEAPPGTMGAFVEDISYFKGGSEKEMLLAAGTKMKVLGVRQEGSTTFVRVRVVS